MDPFMAIVALCGFGFLGFSVLVIAAQQTVIRNRENAWRAYAQANQLSFTPNPLGLAGVIDGRLVGCTLATVGSRRHKRTVALFRCALGASVPSTLAMEPQGLGGSLLTAVGLGDSTVGDDRVDGRFWIRGVDQRVREIFREPAVADALVSAQRQYPSLLIGNQAAQIQVDAVPTDPRDLDRTFRVLLSVASAFDRPASDLTGDARAGAVTLG